MLRSYAEESRASAAAAFIDVVVAVVVAVVAFVDVVVAVVVAFAVHEHVPAAHDSSLVDARDHVGDHAGVDNVGDGSFPEREPPP